MDDYLDEEIECLKAQLDVICKNWVRKVGFLPPQTQVYPSGAYLILLAFKSDRSSPW